MNKIILSILVIIILLAASSLTFGKQVDDTGDSSSNFVKKTCTISGLVKGNFRCVRIPGMIYIIESNYGGEICIECPPEYTIYRRGDYFKLTIIGWMGLFLPPLHNGNNLLDRCFQGRCLLVDFEIS